MEFPRRSARLAEKERANKLESPFHIYNPECNLTNLHIDGCCYQQDKRPKLISKTKKNL